MKTYIDVPEMAYITMLLSVIIRYDDGSVTEAGNSDFAEDMERFLENIRQQYHYDKTHSHIH